MAAGMESQGRVLQEIQQGLYEIADNMEKGTLPESLKKVTTKSDVETIRTMKKEAPSVYIHKTFINDLLNITKGKPGVKEIKERLGYISDGSTSRASTIEAINDLYTLAKKYSGSDPLSSTTLKDGLANYNRSKKLGVKTESDAVQII